MYRLIMLQVYIIHAAERPIMLVLLTIVLVIFAYKSMVLFCIYQLLFIQTAFAML